MLPHKRCAYALCRAYYVPQTKRSQYCSDNCRTRASLRRQGKAYTDKALDDKENVFGIVPLRKRARWKLHFSNPMLLEKIQLQQACLDTMQKKASELEGEEKKTNDAFMRLLDIYIKMLNSSSKAQEKFSNKYEDYKQEFSEDKGIGMQLMGELLKFSGGFIDLHQESKHIAQQQLKEEKLQHIADEAMPLYNQILALQKERKELQKKFLSIHNWLQDTITTLNKPELQARRKKEQAVIIPESLSAHGVREQSQKGKQKASDETTIQESRFKNAKQILSSTSNQRLLLKEPLGSFLGKLERRSLAMTITGPPGQGKTHFTFILAKAFCEMKLKVMFFSLEEGNGESFADKMLQYGLDSEEEYFYSSDHASLALLEEAASEFDVIILDSWTLLGEKNESFGAFVNRYPIVIFISIFQQTTGGEIRGGSQPIYDSSINLGVRKGVVYNTKNRYGGKGEYIIFPDPKW